MTDEQQQYIDALKANTLMLEQSLKEGEPIQKVVVTLTVEPEDATVFIGGQTYTGSQRLELRPDSYALTISADNHVTLDQIIRVTLGEPINLFYVLEPIETETDIDVLDPSKGSLLTNWYQGAWNSRQNEVEERVTTCYYAVNGVKEGAKPWLDKDATIVNAGSLEDFDLLQLTSYDQWRQGFDDWLGVKVRNGASLHVAVPPGKSVPSGWPNSFIKTTSLQVNFNGTLETWDVWRTNVFKGWNRFKGLAGNDEYKRYGGITPIIMLSDYGEPWKAEKLEGLEWPAPMEVRPQWALDNLIGDRADIMLDDPRAFGWHPAKGGLGAWSWKHRHGPRHALSPYEALKAYNLVNPPDGATKDTLPLGNHTSYWDLTWRAWDVDRERWVVVHEIVELGNQPERILNPWREIFTCAFFEDTGEKIMWLGGKFHRGYSNIVYKASEWIEAGVPQATVDKIENGMKQSNIRNDRLWIYIPEIEDEVKNLEQISRGGEWKFRTQTSDGYETIRISLDQGASPILGTVILNNASPKYVLDPTKAEIVEMPHSQGTAMVAKYTGDSSTWWYEENGSNNKRWLLPRYDGDAANPEKWARIYDRSRIASRQDADGFYYTDYKLTEFRDENGNPLTTRRAWFNPEIETVRLSRFDPSGKDIARKTIQTCDDIYQGGDLSEINLEMTINGIDTP